MPRTTAFWATIHRTQDSISLRTRVNAQDSKKAVKGVNYYEIYRLVQGFALIRVFFSVLSLETISAALAEWDFSLVLQQGVTGIVKHEMLLALVLVDRFMM